MESVFNYGIIHLLKHDNMAFVIFNNSINRNELNIIGCYQDKSGTIKRVRRDSKWGKMVMELYKTKPEDVVVRGEGGLDKVDWKGTVNGLWVKDT